MAEADCNAETPPDSAVATMAEGSIPSPPYSALTATPNNSAHAVTPMVSEDFCEAIEDAAGLLVALGWRKGE